MVCIEIFNNIVKYGKSGVFVFIFFVGLDVVCIFVLNLYNVVINSVLENYYGIVFI